MTTAQRSSYLTAFLIALSVALLLGGAMWQQQSVLLMSVFLSVGVLVALRKGWLNRNTWI